MSNKRYEIKFVVNEQELVEVAFLIKRISANSPYPKRGINSLYFDTVDYKCVRENLAGISNRDKVRLRWYKEHNFDRIPELEIKKRNGRLGSKIKYPLTNFSSKEINNLSAGMLNKKIFEYLYKNYKINNTLFDYYFPVLLVNYERDYYETKNGIRITIDKNINFRSITHNNSIKHSSKIKYNKYIVELKFSISQKNLVSDLIRNLNLIPKRHSKYLAGISKLGYAIYI
jgi:hypothetical protein